MGWEKIEYFRALVWNATCSVQEMKDGRWRWSAVRYAPPLNENGESDTKQDAMQAAETAAKIDA